MTQHSSIGKSVFSHCSALATMLTAGIAVAQPGTPQMAGSASVGLRSVSVDGSTSKYRENVNLDDGVRLFGATFDFRAAETGTGVDRVSFDARNLGGDPAETIRMSAQKYGVWNLQLDRRRSEYFYEDVILPPALASVTGSTGGDFHHFDFERVRDRAALDITVTPATQVSLTLDRHTRTGESTTTLDIQRDEFDLDRPIDESMNAASIGIQHAWDDVTLVYQHDGRKFENSSDAFLPGASSGINQTDPAELLFFRLDQSYDSQSTGDLLSVIARPGERLDIRASWRSEDLDLEMLARETSAGTAFDGTPFTTDAAGPADISRTIDVQDIEIGYGLNDRMRLVGEVRRHTLEQDGNVLFDAVAGNGAWDIDTTATQLGFELAATTGLVFSAGVSTESRDTRVNQTFDGAALLTDRQTDRSGFFALVAFDAAGGLHLEASVEDDDIDDAFTLASPTSSRRYRLRGRYRWNNGVAINAGVRRDALENDTSGWDAETDQTDLRLTYDSNRLSIAAGVTRIDLTRLIEQQVTAGTRLDLYSIDYGADVLLTDASLRRRIGDRFTVGALFSQYDNDGSFPLRRDDRRAFVELDIGSDYTINVTYRDIEHREDGFDDFDARILEAAFGLRW